jgi:hypothetical protein
VQSGQPKLSTPSLRNDHKADALNWPLADKRPTTLPQAPRLSQFKMTGSSKMALQTFSIENDILEISPQDEIYRFNEAANKQINREAPWAQESVLSFV